MPAAPAPMMQMSVSRRVPFGIVWASSNMGWSLHTSPPTGAQGGSDPGGDPPFHQGAVDDVRVGTSTPSRRITSWKKAKVCRRMGS